uniref:Uncharacterized protein n=1 Tax=Megaselia scalaris TaxID=36166 RepID=T1H3B1_MEGSC
MDTNQRYYDYQTDGYLPEEPSTARVVASRYLLPFLLGIKFNLATIIPLLFGAVVLLLKKATFLAKLAVYVSTLFGVGGAFTLANLGGGLGGGLGFGGGGHFQHHSFGGGGGGGFGGFSPIKSSASYGAADSYDTGYGLLRNERQFKFDKPRSTNEPVSTYDKFYEYEKNETSNWTFVMVWICAEDGRKCPVKKMFLYKPEWISKERKAWNQMG